MQSLKKTVRMIVLVSLATCVSVLAGSRVHALTIDFDSFASGTMVTSIDQVNFSSNVPVDPLVVSTGFDTTSGIRYLGVGDNGSELFLPGDTVSLALPAPAQSISVSFVSTAGTVGGAFSVQVPGRTVNSGALPDAILADGSEVFLVTLTSVTPFSTAELTSDSDLLFAYSIDDVVVPEPDLAKALGLGAGLVASLLLLDRRGKTFVEVREAAPVLKTMNPSPAALRAFRAWVARRRSRGSAELKQTGYEPVRRRAG